MRLPNRYGTITKLSGNRRKPWMVREGRSGLQRPIGYASTRAKALEILAEYNRQPWDVEAKKVTVGNLIEMWRIHKLPKQGASNRGVLQSASRYLEPITDRLYCELKARDMQAVIDEAPCNPPMKGKIRQLWGHLDAYALELDIIIRKYSDLLERVERQPSTRRAISDADVDKLWAAIGDEFVDVALILIYSGWRARELLALKVTDINLDARTMVGGLKTKAGRGRIVPIHHRILPLIERRLAASVSGYLMEWEGRPMQYDYLHRHWDKMMAAHGMDYLAHECRHTLRTRLDRTSANRVCIDRIMGHQSGNTGEQVYTHKTVDELLETIELVTN